MFQFFGSLVLQAHALLLAVQIVQATNACLSQQPQLPLSYICAFGGFAKRLPEMQERLLKSRNKPEQMRISVVVTCFMHSGVLDVQQCTVNG